jgi:uncharacterized protein (DUF1800 family)
MGVDQWIDLQLTPAKIPDAATDAVLAGMETQRKRVFELIADHPDPQELQQRFNQAAAQLRANPSAVPVVFNSSDSALMRTAQQRTQQLVAQITAARLLRAVASERQLQEVMTDFWENHFSVFIGKSPNGGVRSRRDSPARARQVSRSRRCRRDESADALLPR